MNRRVVYTVGIALILFFLFFNPFRKRGEREVQKPYVSKDTVAAMDEFMNSSHKTPEEFLVDHLQDHEIVFLGEYGQIKQHVEVLHNVIPMLHQSGIADLGVDFALYEDQDEIDRILAAEEYDEPAVHRILFNRMVIWGFEEYADVFRIAWALNREIEADEKPFRIVGLNVHQQWEFVESERDISKPEVIAKVFEEGIPDAHMAQVIKREFINRDKKALIFLSLQHAFTDFVAVQYGENAEKNQLAETRRAGKIVYDLIGDRASTVLMHSPWPYKRAELLAVFPANGVFESVFEELPQEFHRAGFLIDGSDLDDLAAGRSDFAYKYDGLKLKDMCDGYIIVGPIEDYQMVTPIDGFIDEDNIDRANRDFPGANVEDISAQEMNDYIVGLLDNRKKYIERF